MPESDRLIYERAGSLREPRWDGRPALVVVDALWAFIGHHPVDVLDAIAEYPTACGRAGWDGMERIAQVLAAFRRARLPVIYVCADGRADGVYGPTTRTRWRSPGSYGGDDWYQIPDRIAPAADEVVMFKPKASAFFRTSLDIVLWRLEVDTVVLAGSTTCGCVRASAVDSHSLGFETIVLEDAVWDRSPFSHAVSLFELNRKYAAVVGVDEACARIAGLERPGD